MPFSNNNSSNSNSNSGRGFANRSSSASSSNSSSSGRGFANRGSSSPAPKKKEELPPFDTSAVDKSIANAQMRIKDAGGEIKPDKRNWFEKATNLPQGQNALFDAFEIIGRPQQALYGWLKGKLDNKPGAEIEKDAIAGFKGKADRITGSELLRDYAGLENKYARAGLGFAADVASDPTNVIPVAPVAKIIKKGLTPVVKGLDKVTDALPVVNKVKNDLVLPTLKTAKEGLGNIFKYQYGWNRTLDGGADDTLKNLYDDTENAIKYQSENSLRDIAQAAKESGGVKTGEDVGRLAEKDLKQVQDIEAYELPGGLPATQNKQVLKDLITSNRDTVKTLGKEVNSTRRGYQEAIGETADGLNATESAIRKLYMGLERKAGKDVSKETRANLREASKEAARIESQLSNFGKNESALLRNFKQQIRAAHEQSFDIVKAIRAAAPNGIKGVTRNNLPSSLHNFLREGGKGIDEVASELGFKTADDLVNVLGGLKNLPRKLDDATVERLARSEMERMGALKNLEDTRLGLEDGLKTIKSSIKDITRNANKVNAAKATEKAFADISDNAEYKALVDQRKALKGQLDNLRGESKAEKSSKIAEIKNVENEIGMLKQSLKKPKTYTNEFVRPVRDMPTDPKIIQATQKIVDSNETLKNWAKDNDIPIREIEGYMRHVLSAEENALRKAKGSKQVDRARSGMNNPDKGVLKGREILGSVEDINDRIGRKFFEPNAFFATAVGQKKLIDYVNAVKFRREILNNPKFAKPFVEVKKGETLPKGAFNKKDPLPPGAEVVNLNKYSFLKPGSDKLEEIGGEYVVTKGVRQALERYQHLTTDEGMKGFLKAFDTVQGGWKKLALLSVGYHARNAIGAMFNNYVTGMDIPDIIKYTGLASKEVKDALKGKESALYDAYRREGLSSSSQHAIEFAKHSDDPGKAITNAVKNQSRTTGEKIRGLANPLRLSENSQALGNTVDQANRFALFKWAVEKKGMTPKQAAEKVRETQFDYSRTTKTEKELLTRLMPFYRWSRNNIPFQLRKFAEDPARYSRIDKLRRNAQDSFGLEEQDTPDYMKQNFYIPVSGEDGKGTMFGANLPVGDLTKLSSLGKLGLDSLTPAAKLPIELVSNRNLFFNNDIQRFEGQEKKYQVPNDLYGLKIPGGGKELGGLPVKVAYGLEQATGQPGRALAKTFGKQTISEEENSSLRPTLGMSSLLKKYDVKETNLRQKQKELRELSDYLDYLEQEQGKRARTVTEIKKGTR